MGLLLPLRIWFSNMKKKIQKYPDGKEQTMLKPFRVYLRIQKYIFLPKLNEMIQIVEIVLEIHFENDHHYTPNLPNLLIFVIFIRSYMRKYKYTIYYVKVSLLLLSATCPALILKIKQTVAVYQSIQYWRFFLRFSR